MRKATKRTIRPLRYPALPLTEKHHDDLAMGLHVAAANVTTVAGCNAFAHQMAVATAAMEISGTHDNHSRALLRSACLMLEKSCETGEISEKMEVYCKTLAAWIDKWIGQGRITYDSLTKAKRIIGKLDRVAEGTKNGVKS
jgi:hypothetical protein